jgi:hypothetical protein
VVSCDPADQDLDVIHAFLVESYWAKASARNGRAVGCVALLHAARRRGKSACARDLDRATIAYLGDVFVLPSIEAAASASGSSNAS